MMNKQKENDQRMTNYLRIIALPALFLFTVSRLCAQNWEVPDEQSRKVAPFKFTTETAKKGDELFHKNCMSCHGEPARGNFVNLTPPPGDPATDKFQKKTDGTLFYKITTGRGAMPEFKNVLSEEERWQIISYFRSFNKAYQQPEPQAAPAGKYGGMDIQVKMELLSVQKKIKVTALGNQKNSIVPISGVEMNLYAKRYFGDLPIDERKTTNASGEAVFEYKEILPGDKEGNVTFKVKLNADGLSGFRKEISIKAGSPMNLPALTDARAMWADRSNAPIWLIAAYSLVVLAVWSVLGYIISQIHKIKKLGNQSSK